MTHLNLFITDSPGNHTGYTDKDYDKLVLQSKSRLAGKPMKRWTNLLKAEQLLIQANSVIVPLYQNGTAYLQKGNVTNLINYKINADNYKWIDVEK